MTTGRNDVGLDTALLRPSQISPREREILFEIEERLAEVGELELRDKVSEEFKPHRHALSEDRRQRVLLLDGGRGTGKTSFLLTLMNRWNHAAGDECAQKWEFDKEPPNNVRVIRNLDFDPLPTSMPLLAGIVHAWRPLAQYYDTLTFGDADICDDEGRRHLMDDWHTLFRVAAAGWSELPRSKGLIEEVLDREEQVRDWQFFRDHWVWFVDRLISVGKCLKKDRDRLADRPAFVVVIDDVDLQVERVRELLPALRLLAHDNVFFLVAADLDHLTAMLTLEFYGQQQRLANTQRGDVNAAYASEWARELARASVEKVFPLRNRWRLELLTLSQLLRYPGHDRVGTDCSDSRTIHGVLDRITTDVSRRSYPSADKSGATKAGDAVGLLADCAEKALVRLTAGSYRSVQQLWQTVSDVVDHDGVMASQREPAQLLARLVTVDPTAPAAILHEEDDEYSVQVTTGGELAALYLPGPTDPGGVDDIVVSGRADFVYIPADDKVPLTFMSSGRSHFNFTAGLIAKTLQELNFPVDATTLTWNAHLTMAWTAWHGAEVNASFAWPWHTHPRPDELLKRTAQWAKYLRKIGGVAEQRNIRERHAYAWVYYEREAYFQRLAKEAPSVPDPLALAGETVFPWGDLLAFIRDDERVEEAKEWTTRTLPLLARPEIGLHPGTQETLLAHTPADERVLQDLRDQRRRLATNAVMVAGLRRGKREPEPSGKQVEDLLRRVERHHTKVYNRKSSAWNERVELNAGKPAE